MSGEFDLIKRYFSRPVPEGYIGPGDDCAVFQVRDSHVIATSIDTLVEGVHFFSDTNPYYLGRKALAVNLSDLAAMGAIPLGCLLSLSLPLVNEEWLQEFANGFYSLSDAYKCPLLGGDTTSGDTVSISVTVFGQAKHSALMKRSAAKVGDYIWLTGNLGAPHIALQAMLGNIIIRDNVLQTIRQCLENPNPPVIFASQLGVLANAAIDISDGLIQDIEHITAASNCGAVINYNSLPVHPSIAGLDSHLMQEALLSGGDVYQLCFTANPKRSKLIVELAEMHGVSVSHIGHITDGHNVVVNDSKNIVIRTSKKGFDHFQ